MSEAACIAVVGLLVGLLSGRTGLGGGLTLLVLPWFGVAWPTALLAAKLPLAACDAAAWWSGEQPRGAPSARKVWTTLGGAAAAAAAAFAWACGPAPLAPALCAAALVLALGLHACPRPAPTLATLAWSAYIGGWGMGAGLLYRAAAPGPSGWQWAPPEGWRPMAAVANTAATATLLVFAPWPDAAHWPAVGCLVLAQAAGAALGARRAGRRTASFETPAPRVAAAS